MTKSKIKKQKGQTRIMVNRETGEKFGIQFDDSIDLSETDFSKFFEEAFKFFKFESYLMFWQQEEIPQIMLKALPDQMQQMLVPCLVRCPDVLECFIKAVNEAMETINGKKQIIH